MTRYHLTRYHVISCVYRYEGQLFVISCVNSSSVVEKAVQLWQCSSTLSPNHVRISTVRSGSVYINHFCQKTLHDMIDVSIIRVKIYTNFDHRSKMVYSTSCFVKKNQRSFECP